MSNVLTWLKERTRYSVVVFKELVKTDFQLRYQGSFLGVLWSVLKPLMLFAVMYMVFVRFLKFSDGTPTFAISPRVMSMSEKTKNNYNNHVDSQRNHRPHCGRSHNDVAGKMNLSHQIAT